MNSKVREPSTIFSLQAAQVLADRGGPFGGASRGLIVSACGGFEIGPIALIVPLSQVTKKISMSGSHVPTKLVNMTRLCRIPCAMTLRSNSATNALKTSAVDKGARAPRTRK